VRYDIYICVCVCMVSLGGKGLITEQYGEDGITGSVE
jgi:hypothetical protein